MRSAFIDTLIAAAENNSNIWLLSGDLGFSVLEPFAARFADRFVNVGVAEQNMAGMAAGIALSGKTVFIYSIGNFPTFRCLEQLRNDVCHHAADVKVVAVGGGYAYGSQGYTHHAIEDVAIMSALPGMEVFAPCDPAETRAATQRIAASGKPSYLRLSRAGEPELGPGKPNDPYRPRVLREGGDVLILASGPIASVAMAAAEQLGAEGVDVGVASVACIKPLDEGFVREVALRARLIATLEEHVLRGGLYAAVAAALAFVPGRAPVLGLGISEQLSKMSVAGSRDALLAAAGLSPSAVAVRIKQAIAGQV
jgi:transketolase